MLLITERAMSLSRMLGHKDTAIKELEKAVELDPKNSKREDSERRRASQPTSAISRSRCHGAAGNTSFGNRQSQGDCSVSEKGEAGCPE
jgi:hypothetical protein